MSSATRRLWRGLVLATLVGATGCGDGTGIATRYDPEVALRQLDEVLYPLETGSDILLALDLAVATLEAYDGSAFALVASAPLTAVAGPDRRLRAALTRRGRGAVRRSGPGPVSPEDDIAAALGPADTFIVPASIRGATLVWDRVRGYVPSRLGGGPARGVRFLLYRMDDRTGYPIEPLDEIGYLELTDEDSGSSEGVRVRAVRTSGSSRVLADYVTRLDVDGSWSEGAMEIVAEGTFGGTDRIDLDLWQRFRWSQARDEDELELRYRYRQGGDLVEMDGQASSRYEAAEWSTFDFELWFKGRGPDVEVAAQVDRTGSLRGEIRQEGREVVHVEGTESAPRFEGRSDRLDWRELDALERLWVGIADLVWYSDWLLAPADVLILDG